MTDCDTDRYDADPIEPGHPVPTAHDHASAAGLMARREDIWRSIADIDRLAEAEHQRVSAWRDARLTPLNEELERLDHALDGFMTAFSLKTFDTPTGTARLRISRGRVVVSDPEAFISWAIASNRWELLTSNPSKRAIEAAFESWKSRVEPDGTEVFQFVTSDGEKVPGIEAHRPTTASLTIKHGDVQ